MCKSMEFLTSVVTFIFLSILLTACNANVETEFPDEDISESYIEPTLNDGCFYLNGNIESCYFNIHNGDIQLIVENDKQMHELFDLTAVEHFEYEDWSVQLESDWNEPKPYIIHTAYSGRVNVGWDPIYDNDGNLSAYSSAKYINEDNFEFVECKFMRVQTNSIS